MRKEPRHAIKRMSGMEWIGDGIVVKDCVHADSSPVLSGGSHRSGRSIQRGIAPLVACSMAIAVLGEHRDLSANILCRPE